MKKLTDDQWGRIAGYTVILAMICMVLTIGSCVYDQAANQEFYAKQYEERISKIKYKKRKKKSESIRLKMESLIEQNFTRAEAIELMRDEAWINKWFKEE